MENKGIINFKDFFGQSSESKKFDKNQFSDFFLEKEENGINESFDLKEEEEEDGVEFNDEPIEETPRISKDDHHPEIQEVEEEDEDEEVENIVSESNDDDFYIVYKDKSEDFSCDIQLEGANLKDTEARLILESDDWNLMFPGEIDNKGKCVINLKKLNILNEGTIGKIKLEIIADDTIFTPWESDFKVKMSKKVFVKIHESKSNKKSFGKKSTGVKVNVKR